MNPLDVVPPPCNATNSVYQRVLPNIRAHEIDPTSMGFGKNIGHIFQSAVSAKSNHGDETSNDRIRAWELEAKRLGNNSLLERMKLMSMSSQCDLIVFSKRRELIYQFF